MEELCHRPLPVPRCSCAQLELTTYTFVSRKLFEVVGRRNPAPRKAGQSAWSPRITKKAVSAKRSLVVPPATVLLSRKTLSVLLHVHSIDQALGPYFSLPIQIHSTRPTYCRTRPMPLALRPSLDAPPTPEPVPHLARVSIRHPVYNSVNTLLELDAVDTDEQGRHSVLFAVAHTSAAVVANNEFGGWLSTTKKGDEGQVQLAAGDLLAPGVYYFHVSNSDKVRAASDAPNLSPYPVVPSFRHWRFPPQLPDCWMQAVIDASQFPQDVRARDESCLITRHRLVTSVAQCSGRALEHWVRKRCPSC